MKLEPVNKKPFQRYEVPEHSGARIAGPPFWGFSAQEQARVKTRELLAQLREARRELKLSEKFQHLTRFTAERRAVVQKLEAELGLNQRRASGSAEDTEE